MAPPYLFNEILTDMPTAAVHTPQHIPPAGHAVLYPQLNLSVL